MILKFIGTDTQDVLVKGEEYTAKWYETKKMDGNLIVIEVQLDDEEVYSISYNSREEVVKDWRKVK